ncbi:excinuclease ABC subunit UvrC [Crassaminicella thermophila]|uniref:UvrABC system protein C n=1 Tax=Crassaminicella thermophila TaxID=2599308 RepID=A0A5C0SCA9_CRATE|nr:excinuclease ABC subunit UvrC [Crassaminicella thermophila]QEK11562.1 excinuclease ABC subunit UvrC [Crassaminicella thermophila]
MFDIKEQLKKLPQKPGVYLMKDSTGEIIYVGKAISLKNRVRQYFQSSKNHSPKVLAMVGNISEFEYILTDSEVEALILEANLIKKHRPKYNVLLRDDKQYPYIKVTIGEKYPRVFKTRRVIKDGARYFGPYINVGAVNNTIEMLKKFYRLRTCNKNLEKNKDRACLNYHIGRCLGPCQGHIDSEEYMKMIDEIVLFLGGKHEALVKKIEKKMKDAAASMQFEKAAEYRDQIIAINNIMEKQKMVLASDIDQDLIAMARGGKDICVMVFFVRGGKLIGREHYMLSAREDEERGEIISAFIKQFYAGAAFVPKEILLQEKINDLDVIEKWLSVKKGSKVLVKIPHRGEKRALLELVYKNAVDTLSKFRDKIIKDKEKSEGAIKELREYLNLSKPLFRIESFDISNTQGVNSVASMVVFENGKPKYSDYRRFKIKTIEGQNDYGSMQEVIYRRFKRGIEEKDNMKEKGIIDEEGKFSKFPDLILIDGGVGQVNAAKEVLNALGLNIPMAGMVKDDRHKTKDLVYNGKIINIKKNQLIFQLIGKIQEETHRFAITYHKSLRGKTAVQSILEEIPGIGEKRRIALLKYFKTIEKIKKASIDELSQVKGMNKRAAKEIKDYFSKKNTKKE